MFITIARFFTDTHSDANKNQVDDKEDSGDACTDDSAPAWYMSIIDPKSTCFHRTVSLAINRAGGSGRL